MDLKKIFLNFESFLFFSSQMVVGALNYFFQISAAKTLTGVEFGSWSHWLAEFSVASFAGLWIQYLASIGDLSPWLKERFMKFLVIFLLASLLLTTFLHQEVWAFALGWFGALACGYYVGKSLRQRQFRALALATLLGVGFKFAWIFFDPSTLGFDHSVILSPTMVAFFLMFLTKEEISLKISLSRQAVLASLGLAFFASWVPQVDLLVAGQIISAEELGILAKLILLSKAFYFGFQILAQILLGYQVQEAKLQLQIKNLGLLAGVGFLSVIVGIGISFYFHWPVTWVALSLLHATSLCLLFLLLQEFSAKHRGTLVMGLCGLSLLLASVGVLLSLKLETYWLCSIFIELMALGALLKSRTNASFSGRVSE